MLMSNNGHTNLTEYYPLLGRVTRRAFIDATDGNIRLADNELLHYVKNHLDFADHNKISELQKTNFVTFMQVVTVITHENPRSLSLFLNSVRRHMIESSHDKPEVILSGCPEKR